ncbi:MAG: hypothetical protein AB1324_00205 [Candidatus Micrarchaeota archaeon]
MAPIHSTRSGPKPADAGATSSPFGTALAEAPRGAIAGQRLHNGLPVMSSTEYDSLYRSRSTESEVRIFDFTGYVEDKSGKLHFRDVLALNGLRGGVHVGIDGTSSYGEGAHGLSGPSDVGEYVVYVTVPAATQKLEGVLCRADSCCSVADYRARESGFSSGPEIEEEIRKGQGEDGWIVDRLLIKPQEPGARDAIRVLALAISEYLKRGHPLEGLKGFIDAAESHLLSGTAMPDNGSLLYESPETAWQRFMENIGSRR